MGISIFIQGLGEFIIWSKWRFYEAKYRFFEVEEKSNPQTLYHKLKPTTVDQEKKCYHMRILNDHFFYLKNVNLPVSIEEKAKFL